MNRLQIARSISTRFDDEGYVTFSEDPVLLKRDYDGLFFIEQTTARQLDAFCKGLRLSAADAGYLVLGRDPYPVRIRGRRINRVCFEGVDNHRIDVAFKAPCQASQGPGMSPALAATQRHRHEQRRLFVPAAAELLKIAVNVMEY